MEKEDVEIALLLEAIYQCYGYDFRGYARASLTRRIRKGIHELGLKNISEAIPRVIHDWKFYKELTGAMLVHVTEMFRNPSCYKKLRNEIIPYLKTFPTVRIWSAGMSTGEEVYSLAILLKEEGLLEKTQNNGKYDIADGKDIRDVFKPREQTCEIHYYYSSNKRFVVSVKLFSTPPGQRNIC